MRSPLRAVSIVVLVVMGGSASGQEPPPHLVPEAAPGAQPALHASLRTYFGDEWRTGVFFAGFGAASLATGAGLWLSGTEANRGAAVPLLAVGALQAALGTALTIRTPGQVARLQAQLSSDPPAAAKAERGRMAAVNGRWWIYRAVELSLFFAGVGLAGAGGVNHNDFALGAGLGLAVEAFVALLVDHFAESRAHVYGSALKAFRF